jgi:hypothetical protein
MAVKKNILTKAKSGRVARKKDNKKALVPDRS